MGASIALEFAELFAGRAAKSLLRGWSDIIKQRSQGNRLRCLAWVLSVQVGQNRTSGQAADKSANGQKRRNRDARVRSALPPTSDPRTSQ
jgi:hypothetical protein